MKDEDEQSAAMLNLESWARDNVTMISGHKVVCNCHFTIFVVATPFDIEA